MRIRDVVGVLAGAMFFCEIGTNLVMHASAHTETDATVYRVVILRLLGAVLFLGMYRILRFHAGQLRGWWWGLLCPGACLRIVAIHAPPMLADDVYRYLWDGGVVAHGINSYQWAPADVRLTLRSNPFRLPIPLRTLAREATPVPDRIDYPMSAP